MVGLTTGKYFPKKGNLAYLRDAAGLTVPALDLVFASRLLLAAALTFADFVFFGNHAFRTTVRRCAPSNHRSRAIDTAGPAGVRYSVARLESFLVTKTQCDPIAEGIKKIVLSLIVFVADSEILDLIDEMVS